jgi:energy-coupling factor transporter transmembrane protein EcfT
MSPLPRGEHALHPLLVMLVLLILVVKPLVELDFRPVFAMAISVLIGAILRQIFAPGRITFRRIEGAIAAYPLIGLVFACFYDLLHGLVPAAFLHHGEPARATEQVGSYLFFSFITLTTTGYGDIVPVHPVARSLAILEALTGQLYLAILLARLVSLQISSRP